MLQINQDCVENMFSVVRSMGGSYTHPNPLEFATRARIVKITNNVDALLPDNTNVKLAMDNNTDEPYMSSEIGTNLFIMSTHPYVFLLCSNHD